LATGVRDACCGREVFSGICGAEESKREVGAGCLSMLGVAAGLAWADWAAVGAMVGFRRKRRFHNDGASAAPAGASEGAGAAGDREVGDFVEDSNF
jgi:hypothetical protein